MQIVIEISDDEYRAYKHYCHPNDDHEFTNLMITRIANGVVLPKGHGDLIDRNDVISELETDYHKSLSDNGAKLFVEITNYIDDAEAIILADKESKNV